MKSSPTSRPRTTSAFPCACVLLSALVLSAMPVRAGSLLRATYVTVGQDSAVVRERRTVMLPAGEDEFILGDVPPEADLSSLVVRSRRVLVELLEWRRVSAPEEEHPSLAVSGDSSAVLWRRSAVAAGVAPSESVRCRISSPVTDRPLDVEVVYILKGLAWSADYQVAVRGEQAGETEPVSVDLTGLVRLENRSSRVFADAVVMLVGAPELPSPPKDPGFLMVDEDSALADLWRPRPPERRTEFEYDLPGRVTIPARSDTDAVLVRTLRTPATRLYSMVAEEFPVGVEGKDRPLRKLIVFRNTEVNRMGMTLPPGRVQVFLGGMRTDLLQEAWFNRTPPNGEIRIDLGAADEVRGLRVAGERSPEVAGYFEQDFSVTLKNGRDTDILVEVDEKPPVSLEWDVVSATKAYREAGHRLLFNTPIRARGEETIEYRLRIRQPAL